MSSKSVNIVDYNKAIANGVIEGHFNEDRTVFHFDTVKSVNSKGAVLIWDLEVRLYDSDNKLHPINSAFLTPKSTIPDGLYGYIITNSKQISVKGVEGKVRDGVKPTIITCGKNLKKANSTNPITQAIRDALSKYNAQKHKGNNAVLSSVESSLFTIDNRPPPMLVKKIDETADATLTEEDVNLGLIVQRKYNGTRSPAHIIHDNSQSSDLSIKTSEKTSIKIDMYSRTNKDHLGLHHIKSELAQLFASAPSVPESFILSQLATNTNMTSDGLEVLKLLYSPANLFVDGELYLHGKSLNWISGQVRKEGDEGTLEYWIYDCFFPAAIASGYQMSSKYRQAYLDMLFESVNLKYVKRVTNYKVNKLSDIYKYRDEFLAEGYEGAIVRKDWAGYTYGNNNYHSSNLVKVKPIYDAEFKVVGFTQGTKGKDVGALIWICEVDTEHMINPGDKTFHVVPKDMTYEERYKIFELLNLKSGPADNNFDKYVNGKYLTVEFPERSKKTGKPSQAKALNFRNLDTDSTEDPISLLKKS